MGDCKSLALEWGLFSPVTFAQPQVCGRGEQLRSQLSGGHTRAAVDERKMQVCFLFCLQPATAQEQADLPGQQNTRSSTIKENATYCKTLHSVINSSKVLASVDSSAKPSANAIMLIHSHSQ